MITIELAKKVVAEWLDEHRLPDLIERDMPSFDLSALTEILAIVGPRRCGKTCYMYQLMTELIAKGICDKIKILFIDFEDYRLEGMKAEDIDVLFTAFNQLTGGSPVYIFFDEVQNLPGWSRVLRTLHNQNRYRIIISGSNSELLSREISTELRGRYRDVFIMPFSYLEILRFRGLNWSKTSLVTAKRGQIMKVFDEYMQQGGFPEVIKKDRPYEQKELLQNYYRTIFYRDIMERYNVRAKSLLEAIMRYCLNISSDMFSISAFEKCFKTSHNAGSKRTIANYFHYLAEAFLVIANEKFSYSPRKRIMNPKKVYVMDPGFLSLATEFSENRGKKLENVVAIELYRRRSEMYYFRGHGECDFLIKDGSEVHTAIQVTWALAAENRKRELSGLTEAMKAFKITKGIILTYDTTDRVNQDGYAIEVQPVWKWLLGQ